MTSVLEADRGDTNVFDLDANVALDQAQDKIWFTAKRRFSDVDTSAISRKGFNVAGLSGIAVVDAPAGKFQVTVPRAELASLEDQALLFDVQLLQGTRYTTIQKGVLRLVGEVTQGV